RLREPRPRRDGGAVVGAGGVCLRLVAAEEPQPAIDSDRGLPLLLAPVPTDAFINGRPRAAVRAPRLRSVGDVLSPRRGTQVVALIVQRVPVLVVGVEAGGGTDDEAVKEDSLTADDRVGVDLARLAHHRTPAVLG